MQAAPLVEMWNEVKAFIDGQIDIQLQGAAYHCLVQSTFTYICSYQRDDAGVTLSAWFLANAIVEIELQ